MTVTKIYIYIILGITPLHIAMMNDDTACMDILLRYGANPKILVKIKKYI